MKKLINFLLVITMAFCCLYSFVACSDTDGTEVVSGAVYKIEKDENGEEYAVLTKYRLNETDAEKVADGDFDSLGTATEVEALRNPVINVYETKNAKGETVTYKVKEVAEEAFSGQLVIKSVTFGENVEKLGAGCLAGCANLEKVTAPFVGAKKVAYGVEKTMAYLFGTTEADGTTSATVKYNGADGSATYYIPDSLKEIVIAAAVGYELPEYAFNGIPCKTITVNNLTKISEGAFGGNTKLEKYVVPATVKEIGEAAFSGCTSLVELSFANGSVLTTIGKSAFSGCTKLGYANFAGEGTVIIPDSVTTIGEKAFASCTTLKNVVFGTSVKALNEAAFSGCTKLESVEFKTTETVTLSTMAFHACDNLKTLKSANGKTLSDFQASFKAAFDEIA